MKVRLNYIEEVLKMRDKYNIDDSDISDIENSSPFQELSDSVLSSITSKLDDADEQNSSDPAEE